MGWFPSSYQCKRELILWNVKTRLYYANNTCLLFILINFFVTDIGHTTQLVSIDITVVDPVIIYSVSVNATVSVGESFRFSCNATNFLRLQWVYMTNSTHSHVLSNTSDGRVTITPYFDLQLNNIAIEDGGTYQCLLSNNNVHI